MKKFISALSAIAIAAGMTAGLTACEWSSTNPQSTPPASTSQTDPQAELAAAKYNAKMQQVAAARESQTKDEEGNVTNDVYTRSSVREMETALEEVNGFDPAGKSADAINEAAAKVDAALAKLVTVDSVVDARLQAAIEQLDLYETDADGNVIYRRYVDNGSGKTTEVCGKDDEGAFATPDKGIDKIDYSAADNRATFYITKDKLGEKMTDFIQTGVVNIFNEYFSDLSRVEFTLHVMVDGEEKVETLTMDTSSNSGIYLAAGLLSVCMERDQVLYEAKEKGAEAINTVLRELQNSTYEAVNGRECRDAVIVFNNEDYVYTATFSVFFTLNK